MARMNKADVADRFEERLANIASIARVLERANEKLVDARESLAAEQRADEGDGLQSKEAYVHDARELVRVAHAERARLANALMRDLKLFIAACELRDPAPSDEIPEQPDGDARGILDSDAAGRYVGCF